MLNIAICGATGYTGLEIIKLLNRHKGVKITSVAAKIDRPEKISNIFPELRTSVDLTCSDMNVSQIIEQKPDLVYLALPHKISMEFAPYFLEKGIKVIDLSADFRLKDIKVYEAYYGCAHKCPKLVDDAVYGLPELYRDKIVNADLLANPGCYPTASILSIAPFLKKFSKNTSDIIIDAKTGVSGAGRKAYLPFHFAEMSENLNAYKVGAHQHSPEIEQELTFAAKEKIEILFTPHLVPMKRGILTTSYISVNKNISYDEIVTAYKTFYHNEPFVRIYENNELPQIKYVNNTNYCDIGFAVAKNKVVIVACIDNLMKGASAQAVQNMNIMFKFNETEGLV